MRTGLLRLLDNIAGNVLAAAVIAAFWIAWAVFRETPAHITAVFATELFLFALVTFLAFKDRRDATLRARVAAEIPAAAPKINSGECELAENELIHEGMLWRLNGAPLESGTDPLEGPLCPSHREVLFYRMFTGALSPTLNDDQYLGDTGFYYCPINQREEFRVHGGLALKAGQVRQQAFARFRNRHRDEASPGSSALNVSVRVTAETLVLTFAPTVVMFLTFSSIEIVNAMPRPCIVSLGLRLRLRYSGWQVLPAGSVPRIDDLPKDIHLSSRLPHLIPLSAAGTARSSVVGHAAFALESLDQSRVGVGQSLDLLTPENMRFEVYEPTAEQTRILALDSAPLSWRRISL